ncbi:ATP-dependent endonuclease [Paenibacillus tarimensis]
MIKIEKVEIKNYRKFRQEDIYFDKNLTVVAGSNNAGKTSVVELLSNILTQGKTMNIDDMNYNARKEDEVLLESIVSNTSTTEEEIIEKLSTISKDLNEITVLITISYDEDDTLTLFSGYLSDIDINKKSYYFLIEFTYKKPKEIEIINCIKRDQSILELFSSLESNIYYCDEHGNDKVIINNKDNFYRLFNYHCVYALRKLSDTSDEKQNFLSKQLLRTVKNDEQWKEGLTELIMDINRLLVDKSLSTKIDKITVDTIRQTLDEFSQTNGGNTGRLGIDFKLENHEIEKVLLEFTKIYFEQDGGGRIKEQKQGLGYSNLIYLLLEAKIFKEKLNREKVNLLVFEEPEAHLHPQMENIFIKFLNRITTSNEYIANEIQEVSKIAVIHEMSTSEEAEKEVAVAVSDQIVSEKDLIPFQMFITTHSSEMAKSIRLSSIRVLRPKNHIESKIFDLRSFITGLDSGEIAFYNKFFQFNMIEMIFADKLILFEGDAERLLLKYIIVSDERFKVLSSQYISYIQVGGAYAYNYLKLINFLQIKTLILSDIDYKYDSEDIEKEVYELIKEVVKRDTTNKTIEKITKKTKIKDIFKSQIRNKGNYSENQFVCLKFQTYTDGYARTLEDAILRKLLKIKTVFNKVSRQEFQSYIDQYNLQMLPSKKVETSIRDRVDKLSRKTDFIYSMIEHNQIEESVPTYILEGLKWLQE